MYVLNLNICIAFSNNFRITMGFTWVKNEQTNTTI